MKTTTRTSLEEWLEIQGGFQFADFTNMPIAQTQAEKDAGLPVKFVPNTGLIRFEGVGMYRHGFKLSEACIFDHNTKLLYAVVAGSHKDGSPRFLRINIDAAATLDLSKPTDRKNYYVLLHSPLLQDGPRAAGAARFKIINKDQEAEKFNENRKFVRKASDIVDEMGGESMRKFAILFGINDKDSDAIIKRALYEKAEKDPKTFIARYESGDRALWEVVKKAVAEYILEQREGNYFYQNLVMGINEEMVVDTLKKKPELVQALIEAIDARTNKKAPSVMVDKKPSKKAAANPFMNS